MFDLNTEFGQRVASRLKTEAVIWLTTISEHGVPQPRPVWFLWTGDSFLTFSTPESYKVRHIAHNPNVALNFNSDAHGNDIVVFTGTASFVESEVPAGDLAAYVEKYGERMAHIGLTPESMAQKFSVTIRIMPVRVRGH